DSIKRVEILGTVQDKAASLPPLNPEDLAECRTLGEIVAYLNAQSTPAEDNKVTTAPVGVIEAHSNDVDNIHTTQESVGAADDDVNAGTQTSTDISVESSMKSNVKQTSATDSASQLQTLMLDVVAEKTGYPAEMLSLDMDMEADLGIDSIKRVEILGTVQDKAASLPPLNPEDLAECRTLGEIVTYMKNQSIDEPSVTEAQAMTTKVMPLSSDETVEIELPQYGEVVLAPLPEISHVELSSYLHNACIIITDDGHNAGALAEKLRLQHLQVAVIRLPEGELQSPLSAEIESFQPLTNDEMGLRDTLAHILHSFSKVAGFIHLQPTTQNISTSHSPLMLNEKSLSQLKQAFLWAKLLQPELTKPHGDFRHCFMTVSRMDGGFGYVSESLIQGAELNQGALSGLTKTLSHEWDNVFCRALDITPEMDAQAVADATLLELCDQSSIYNEVGISFLGRTQLVIHSSLNQEAENNLIIEGAANTKSASVSLQPSDTVLVTGGAKGVTKACALALAKKAPAHFILAGRSQYMCLEDRPTWTNNKGLDDLQAAAIAYMKAESQQPTPKQIAQLIEPIKNAITIDSALQDFKEVGATAEYVSMDVTDPSSITKALAFYFKVADPKGIHSKENVSLCHGITGLIHGAGVLADKHIQDKSLDEFNRVYDTKITGLASIMNVIDVAQLKVLALFSSAAAFYGNKGQSDYAMANEILNKAALQLSVCLPQTKVMSFDWGPWDGGMVNAALKKMFIERGVDVIPLDSGAELFARQLLSSEDVQIVVGSSMQGEKEAGSHSRKEKISTKDNINVKKTNASELSFIHSQTFQSDVEQNNQAVKNVGIIPLTQVVIVTRRLNLESLPVVLDHCIGGNPVLPAVFAIQWMREAALSACGLAFTDANHVQVQVEDYQLLKGIIFDLFEDQVLKLTLMPEGTADINKQVLKADLYCNEKPQSRARLVVTLVSNTEQDKVPSLTDKAALKLETSSNGIINGHTLYKQGVLFHGPRLQGIRSIQHINDESLLALCQLPQIAPRDSGCFPPCSQWGGCQPYAEDLLLQAMLIWARFKYDSASLPTSIDEFIAYKPLLAGDKGVLLLEVVEQNLHRLKANVSLYHQNGELSVMMKGAVVTISDSLNEAFLSNTMVTNKNLVDAQNGLEADGCLFLQMQGSGSL
ncbi:KR domain-containing protein, partial [Shewanella surugensis]